jgi:GNAT superfamily N-acetyltransferase
VHVTLKFVLDPELDTSLHEQLVSLWTDVTNAGGAVGFVPPVKPSVIVPEADKHLVAMAEGRTRMVAGYADGRLGATAFITYNTHRLMTHWAWVYTVMVHPDHQGKGYGLDLLRETERCAREELGLEALRLTCRGGRGLERFYASAGYKEVGRIPRSIRVAAGDDRDDVFMWLPLT